MSERVFNFSAGPAVLPEPVLRRARGALWDLESSGIGVLEHSHRGAEIDRVFETAIRHCRDLARIPNDYAILFVQGGASSQFFMAPMNLLGQGQTADYINTGSWSKKAIKEAKKLGNVHVAASSEDTRFDRIPSEMAWSESPAYVHFTSNNTIAGTEWSKEPNVPDGVPLVCDASSDIFSRPIDVSKYGLIYAGAQKNLGPAGVTLVIIRKDLADRAPESLPTMLQYRTHIASDSRYNTPPVFGVYMVGQVLAWLKERGGLQSLANHNRDKARLIYTALDESSFYSSPVKRSSRSQMNIVFRTPSEDLDARFIAAAATKGLRGLKGHRSVGGIRASIYNAFPKAGCEALVEHMAEFERENA